MALSAFKIGKPSFVDLGFLYHFRREVYDCTYFTMDPIIATLNITICRKRLTTLHILQGSPLGHYKHESTGN